MYSLRGTLVITALLKVTQDVAFFGLYDRPPENCFQLTILGAKKGVFFTAGVRSLIATRISITAPVPAAVGEN